MSSTRVIFHESAPRTCHAENCRKAQAEVAEAVAKTPAVVLVSILNKVYRQTPFIIFGWPLITLKNCAPQFLCTLAQP